MAKIKVKGYEFESVIVKDSFSRRAVQFANNIISSLGKIGLIPDDIDLKLEHNVMKKAPASVSFYVDNKHLHYSYNLMNKYVDNLYVVFKVIDLSVQSLIEDEITPEEFFSEFVEDKDVAEKRKEARNVLGLEHDVNDIDVIDKTYKNLAKKHHPDLDGDAERFKEINNAHKILRRELR